MPKQAGDRREPEILRRGKAFHRRVQSDWERTAKDGVVRSEHTITLGPDAVRVEKGRLDLFVEELGDFVSVVEIKSTDWDRVKPANRRRLAASHRRQIWRYIETFIGREHVDVCAGVIYPSPPRTPGLRREIEELLNDYGLQVVWYDE
jgi:hypothetical protein